MTIAKVTTAIATQLKTRSLSGRAEGRLRNCWSEGKEIFGVGSQVGRRRAAEHERALRCAAGRFLPDASGGGGPHQGEIRPALPRPLSRQEPGREEERGRRPHALSSLRSRHPRQAGHDCPPRLWKA